MEQDHESGAARSVWELVSHSPLEGLWDLRGVPLKVVAKRVWNSTNEDNLFGRASQLAYYFFFALFPMLIAASSVLGLAAKSATQIYVALLNRIATLIPPAAFGIVMDTFNQTTQHSTPGKITLGLLTALWSASVGVSAIQDTLNAVYKVKEKRSYWRARGEAILLTIGVVIVFTVALATLLGCDVGARLLEHRFTGAFIVAWFTRITGWAIASVLVVLVFALLYFFSPDVEKRKWRWFTPGSAIGLFGWIAGSLGLRLYLHWFNSYSVTYGSLGAVIILLTWFYVIGLMLLLGAEVNSEIEAAVLEQSVLKQKAEQGTVVPIDPGKTK
ncbi:MAG: YihY/virulence factor BrkB family protein [Acidobacteria bacterium]|nr:YihY/virulence factor BrkB family protein [Acidobacteriota bacterium]